MSQIQTAAYQLDDPPRQLSPRATTRIVAIRLFPFACAIVVLWAIFFIQFCWGIDLLARPNEVVEVDSTMLFAVIAGLGTLVATFFAIRSVRTALRLAVHGIVVVGQISSVSGPHYLCEIRSAEIGRAHV